MTVWGVPHDHAGSTEVIGTGPLRLTPCGEKNCGRSNGCSLGVGCVMVCTVQVLRNIAGFLKFIIDYLSLIHVPLSDSNMLRAALFGPYVLILRRTARSKRLLRCRPRWRWCRYNPSGVGNGSMLTNQRNHPAHKSISSCTRTQRNCFSSIDP